MLCEKIPLRKHNISRARQHIYDFKMPSRERDKFIQFLDEAALGKVNKGNPVSIVRQLRYIQAMKIPFEYFNKEFTTLTIQDMTRFITALKTGEVSPRGKYGMYTDHSRVTNLKILRIYLKWRLGDTPKFKKLTDWFDFKIKKRSPVALTEDEVLKLYAACKNATERCFIALLFDTGARAEELHNIRMEDIEIPNDPDDFIYVTLKEEYSKTNGRRIGLYWKYTKEALLKYIEERKVLWRVLYGRDPMPLDPLLAIHYKRGTKILKRLGSLGITNKNLHYHLFRKSSSSYYGNKMKPHEVDYRMGWVFSTKQRDTYINRDSMGSDTDHHFKNAHRVSSTDAIIQEQNKKIDELTEMIKKLLPQ